MIRVDTIIKAKYILTMNQSGDIINDGAVAILGRELKAIGREAEILDKYEADDIFDTGNSILMPGMVNTHTHAAMVYFRGLADDLYLDEWLNEHIWPAESALVTPDFVKNATELACLEFINSGVTTFNDMYFFAGISAQVVDRAGLRLKTGEVILDASTPSAKDAESALDINKELVMKYKNHNRISITLCPHSVYACDKNILKYVADLAKKYNQDIHIHLCETEHEVQDIKEQYNMSPVEYLDSLGMLHKNTVLAHSVWLSDTDIALIKDRQAKISHNPISNMKLASGIFPLEMMEGLNVGLGSDGAASNNTLDLFSEMRVCSLLHKISKENPSFPLSKYVVQMATIEAAKVLGLSEKIGSLEIGKKADVISINLNRARLQPIYDLYSHLVYCAESSDVENVLVDGNYLMKNKNILTLDEEKIMSKAQEYSTEIKKYANIKR